MTTKNKELTEQRVREIVQEELSKYEPNINKIGQKLTDKIRKGPIQVA